MRLGPLHFFIVCLFWFCVAGLRLNTEEDFKDYITIESSATRISFNETVYLRCKAHIHNLQFLYWLRDGTICDPSVCQRSVTKTKNSVSSQIIVKNVLVSSNYTCEAKSETQSLVANIYVEVGRKPEDVVCTIHPEKPQPRGHKVSITCRYRSETQAKVYWSEGEDNLNGTNPEESTTGEFYSFLRLEPIRRQRNITFAVRNPYAVVRETMLIQVVDRHLNEECIFEDDCVTPDAICSNNLCGCPSETPVQTTNSIPNACLPAINFGQRCLEHEQCQSADNHTTCITGRCRCLPGYSKDKDRCILNPDRDVFVVVGTGLGLVLIVSSVLSLYFYRKWKENAPKQLPEDIFSDEDIKKL